jgi:glucose-6-phosphate 1-dehydrogenase
VSDPSDALVLFGASGDLAYRKIFPALHAMARRGGLAVPVVGVARSGWTVAQLAERARAGIAEHGGGVDEAAFARLAGLLRYVDGEYQDPATFQRLGAALGGAQRPIFYLAIPPSLFTTAVDSLSAAGCLTGARVVVEKPFGRDLASARALNRALHAVLDEAQIFRIDHYLGKEAVQNLLVFRFANSFLEPIWNRNYVESVQVTMAEAIGLEGRGKFYDETGAIRDVIQNHLLQVVAYLAMEPPVTTYAEAVRDEQVKVFRSIRPLSPQYAVRGQVAGYHAEKGVRPDSNVETYAAVRLHLDSWRWEGVPFLVRAGKRLPVTATEVRVELRRPPLTSLAPGQGNYVRFRLGPDIAIAIGGRVKRFGEGLTADLAELDMVRSDRGDELDPYERLLGDAMRGDATLFAREDAVEAAWSVVDPVLDDPRPALEYEPGTWGPAAAADLARDIGGWDDPA